MLSHIPKSIDFSRIKLLILIYAPSLKELTNLDPNQSAAAAESLSSSFSNIEGKEVHTPGEEKSPM